MRTERKRRPVRARTVNPDRITKTSLELGRWLYPETNYWRPKTRGDCFTFERPCPFVSCKHHLYLDIDPERGSIKLNFPDLEPWELEETCALDVAEKGGLTLEEVGEITNLTRERVRQLELLCAAQIRESEHAGILGEYHNAA